METKTQYLPYARQSINDRDIQEVSQALTQEFISRGPQVEAFEEAVAEYCGASYAVAFSNASTALHACYQAIDTNQADRIYTTPNTYIATISGGLQRGATPVFLDIDLNTGSFLLNQLQFNVNRPSSRGRDIIVPVHFAGIAMDMKEIDKMILNETTVVIEDAAHALGSFYPSGEKVGSCAWSHLTVFSFHPAKTITCGEGGMVTTNDPRLAQRLRQVRNNGIERAIDQALCKEKPWMYDVKELSSNFNFTDIQAALGLSQLKRIGEFEAKRRHLMHIYRESFKDEPAVRMLTDAQDSYTLFHICVVLIDFASLGLTKGQVMNRLEEEGIGSQVHYIPLYKHSFFTNNHADISSYFPNMECYEAQALTLPLYYDLEADDVKRIVNALKKILRKK